LVRVFTLYTTALSANGRKPLAVCHHLGLLPEVCSVNVYKGEGRTPEFLRVHPLGKIPVLVDGDLTLWESNAILQYIVEAYANDRLWPRDPKRRAHVSRWLFWEAAQWQPAMAAVPGLAATVGGLLGVLPERAEKEAVSWEDRSFSDQANFLDDQLRDRAFLAGEELTLADFSVAGMLTYARAASFPFDRWPNVAAWYARLEALEAWSASAVEPWI
jgi:glutathione S-transferase